MESKPSLSALCTAFCVTTAIVFGLCFENVEHCQTRQSEPTPNFTHSQASNFDEIWYFSKFHVQGKAVPLVTIIMDKTNLMYSTITTINNCLLLFNRQHTIKQVNGLQDIHMTSYFPCS